MLFKQVHLHGIKNGEIKLAFRKWKRLRVKKGSLIITSIGQVEILDIQVVDLDNVSAEDAINAGYTELSELVKVLDSNRVGQLYKITVKYHSPDPRIKLRSQSDLSVDDIDQIILKLERLDKYSKDGKWTLNVLQAIRDNPKLKAQLLSQILSTEKDKLKLNVRKLKNLGLTISHKEGYSISPRGKIILEKLLHLHSNKG